MQFRNGAFLVFMSNYKFKPLFYKPTIINKGWGREIVIANENDLGYCGKILHYNQAGVISSAHFHADIGDIKGKSETFLVVNGAFMFYFWNEKGEKQEQAIVEGDCVFIPAYTPHQLKPLHDHSEIYEVSTPHSDDGTVRIGPGASQK